LVLLSMFGHNAAADYSDESTIMENTDRLIHFHIHDAKGKNSHLIIGDGSVDVKERGKIDLKAQ